MTKVGEGGAVKEMKCYGVTAEEVVQCKRVEADNRATKKVVEEGFGRTVVKGELKVG